MSEIADRYRNVAQQFTDRLTAVPDDAWDNPAPCEGWVARDVVRHLVDTASFFLGGGVDAPSVDDDPVGAWTAVRDAIQSALDNPEVAQRQVDSPMGAMTIEQLIARFGIADTLVHTWDLARATGLDEKLDPEEVVRVYKAMEPLDERMRGGTAFGPRVPVPGDADDQTKLIAFTGRTP
ncbi:MAG TPA: TIGR03086 family metal-binding protein [Acidimicrobiales bacterium]|nr:TIGR03086 family metal-binding protein [Acidimicrobiales bacterium]